MKRTARFSILLAGLVPLFTACADGVRTNPFDPASPLHAAAARYTLAAKTGAISSIRGHLEADDGVLYFSKTSGTNFTVSRYAAGSATATATHTSAGPAANAFVRLLPTGDLSYVTDSGTNTSVQVWLDADTLAVLSNTTYANVGTYRSWDLVLVTNVGAPTSNLTLIPGVTSYGSPITGYFINGGSSSGYYGASQYLGAGVRNGQAYVYSASGSTLYRQFWYRSPGASIGTGSSTVTLPSPAVDLADDGDSSVLVMTGDAYKRLVRVYDAARDARAVALEPEITEAVLGMAVDAVTGRLYVVTPSGVLAYENTEP